MDIIFYTKPKLKGFLGIQDANNKGHNIGWIKARSYSGGFCLCIKPSRFIFPHPTGNQFIKKGGLTNVFTFKKLETAKDFINQHMEQF